MSPFVTYPLLIVLASIFIWFAYHLKKDPIASPLDLITSPDTGRLSSAKIGQLVGVVVTSWVIISMAATETLSETYLLLYIGYVAGVDLTGKVLRSKAARSKPPKGLVE